MSSRLLMNDASTTYMLRLCFCCTVCLSVCLWLHSQHKQTMKHWESQDNKFKADKCWYIIEVASAHARFGKCSPEMHLRHAASIFASINNTIIWTLLWENKIWSRLDVWTENKCLLTLRFTAWASSPDCARSRPWMLRLFTRHLRLLFKDTKNVQRCRK